MDSQIESFISRCGLCQIHQSKNVKEPLIAQDIPMLAFSKVGCDILELGGKYYTAKSSREIIKFWLEVFSRFGIPKTIICDNVPFNSYECKQFANTYNFEIITSSPNYPKGHGPNYPKGHGLAEKAVHICKNILKKSANEQQVLLSLLEYRNSKIKDLDFTPSQLLQNRRCRTKLPITDTLLKPKLNDGLEMQFQNKIENYRNHYNKTAKPKKEFKVLDKVLFWTDGRYKPAPLDLPKTAHHVNNGLGLLSNKLIQFQNEMSLGW
ncbi:hypothetical protein QE152_g10505 [Popillia japonica]|uniref:Integrase catalytic domain-containing protein n=1 Tax=Popillia japonica TaxID=7064 RepID=A0AAW1LVI4_POPJA